MAKERRTLPLGGPVPNDYRFEEQDWWVKQIRSIADSYLRWQFNYPTDPVDYRNYRTFLHLAGAKKGIKIVKVKKDEKTPKEPAAKKEPARRDDEPAGPGPEPITIDLDFFAQYHLMVGRTVERTDPADPLGTGFLLR